MHKSFVLPLEFLSPFVLPKLRCAIVRGIRCFAILESCLVIGARSKFAGIIFFALRSCECRLRRSGDERVGFAGSLEIVLCSVRPLLR